MVAGVLALVIAAAVAMAFGAPAWVAGYAYGLSRLSPVRMTPLTETAHRRWTLWTLCHVGAVGSLTAAFMTGQALLALLVPPFLVGSLWLAAAIGRAAGNERRGARASRDPIRPLDYRRD